MPYRAAPDDLLVVHAADDPEQGFVIDQVDARYLVMCAISACLLADTADPHEAIAAGARWLASLHEYAPPPPNGWAATHAQAEEITSTLAERAEQLVVLAREADGHGGTGARYTRGCRCWRCRAANTLCQRRWRKRNYAARVLIDGRLVAVKAPRHGTYTTYSHHGCQCKPCAATGAAAYARRRARNDR